MRVLVTRSTDDAARTAKKLAARGHEALLAPVTRIVPTGNPMPRDPYDALIVTSAHAEAALASLDRSKPIFAVGERTAEPVRAAGFVNVTVAEGDALSLVRLIRGTLAHGLTLLHVTARHHKEEPAASLKASGFTILQWEAYEAKAVGTLPDDAGEALRRGLPEDAVALGRDAGSELRARMPVDFLKA